MEPLLGSVTILERAPGRFSVIGELDLVTAPRLDGLEHVHGPLVLDLCGVTFMDSTGIAALVQLSQRCSHRDCTFLVEACSPPVERVLRITGLYDIFTDDGAHRRTDGDGPSVDLRPSAYGMEPGAAAGA